MSRSWSEEPVTKQDLIITLGVIVAILWVGDQKAVMRTLEGVKAKIGGLLGPDVASAAEEIKP